MKRTQLCVGMLLSIGYSISGEMAYAATYYVSTSGNNSYSCAQAQSTSTPKRTLNNAVACLSGGDTLLVRAGTYPEALLNNVPSGTSWTNKVRIAAYPGETVWMTPTSGTFVLYFAGSSRYIEFDGINLDGDNVTANAVKIESFSASNDPHHIRFQNLEVLGESSSADTSQSRVGIIVVGIIANAIGGNEFLNVTFRRMRNFFVGQGSLGLYIQTSNNLVDGCDFSDFRFGGLQVYNSYGNQANNNIIRNSRFHDPFRFSGAAHVGALIYTTNSGTLFYNNLIYNIPSDGGNTKGIEFGAASANVGFYNNTIYNVGGAGLRVQGSTNIIRNNISYGNSSNNYTNVGSGTVASNNMTDGTNPLFVNAGAGDFRLQSTSRGLDAGVTVALVTTDFARTVRPQGSAYDIGAYEYGLLQASSPSAPAPPRGLRITND